MTDPFPALTHYAEHPVLSVRSIPALHQPANFKPCGLWVSDDADEANWPAWCQSESFRLHCLAVVHDVRLYDDARILCIRTVEELDAFTAEYGIRAERPFFRDFSCDWSMVAQKYQGILITPYQWSRRLFSDTAWYYTWDCASGCIWDAEAIASIRVRTSNAEAA